MMKELTKYSSELPFLKTVEVKRNEVKKHKPLDKSILSNIIQKLRLDWNYNSNAIEGNSLSHGETIALLMEGITAKGKPLKDALDIKGHNDAIDFMLDMIKDERPLNESDIRNLHTLVLGKEYYSDAQTSEGKPTRKLIKIGEYKTSPNHVQTATGVIHHYASPEETPAKMSELVSWYNTAENDQSISKIVLAALFHHKFVEIHPFDDGNGRMSRILTNFILLKFDYPIIVINAKDRGQYYAALAQADQGSKIPMIELIAESIENSLDIYLKAIHGIDISEPDDIDKEIKLFRKEIGYRKEVTKLRDLDAVINISFELFSYLNTRIQKFGDLFLDSESDISIDDTIVCANTDCLNSATVFKSAIEESAESIEEFLYYYLLDSNRRNIDQSIQIKLYIYFKKESYLLIYKHHELLRYYDEEILNNSTLNFLNNIPREIMDTIKNYEIK